ncbi:MAG: SH3 domain-containing protein [Flavobacteriales bacterium]|nr:SH3 domain-containing protein [Bacteroidota bacterium]MCB9241289.1 SH3 domain-containing protein [Flavobacteriales bacterium]
MGLFDIFKKSASTEQKHPIQEAVDSSGFNIKNFCFEENNGIVTLHGLVEDGSDIGRVTRLMKTQPNVRRVINEMDVVDVTDQNIRYAVNIRVKYLNVRRGPGTEHDLAGKLENKDEVVLVKHISKNWLLVKKGDLTGYCSSKYLRKLD